MDKDLVIVALICISVVSFFLWYQWGVSELQNNDNLNNAAKFYLTLKGNSIETNSSTIELANHNIVVITSPGTYEISGCLTDGQIIVDTQDSGTVKLILKGVSINCSRSAPICIWGASDVVIFLEKGTENIVHDGASYLFANLTDNEPNAAIFSKADLTISGDGMLKVVGNYKDGIASKDRLTIEGGTIMVQAVDDGIRGKDYLIIRGGSLILDVGGDGLKSDNTLNDALGYITVEKGAINVNSGGDALHAETNIIINGGQFNITSGGGSIATMGNVSAKGIKAMAGLTINGGEFFIDSADDAIHSDGNLVFNGGALTLLSGGDAVHANGTVEVNGGSIEVIKCFEGLEGTVVTINGGNLDIVSINDGIDAPLNMKNPESGTIYIANGTIKIVSGGDAIQAEKDILIAGGDFALTSGSDSNTATNFSSKGIRGGYNVVVDSGKFMVSSVDNAIHSNGTVKLNRGIFVLSSNDDAVHADNLVEINGGKVNIIRSFEGVEGKSVAINDGEISINSDNNGVDAEDITITKGVININSGGDAIQAETSLTISGGTFNIITTGGAASAKGIKGNLSVKVDGGEFTISTTDDALHSDGAIIINGGSFTISTQDDGIHAEASITINNGNVRITKSYEGIEAPVITINNGNIHITSDDDGINLGVDMRTRPSPGFSRYTGTYYLYINGGYLAVNSLRGDGIDSNGAIVMTGGLVIVEGTSSFGNSALDHVAFNITGGTLIAAGSSGMALPLGNLSKQCWVMLNYNSSAQARPIAAGTIFHVQTTDGVEVFTFKPSKAYQTVIFSSPSITLGTTYEAYIGGNYTGTFNDGLGASGKYTPGTKIYTFTISKTGTIIGPYGWAFPRQQ